MNLALRQELSDEDLQTQLLSSLLDLADQTRSGVEIARTPIESVLIQSPIYEHDRRRVRVLHFTFQGFNQLPAFGKKPGPHVVVQQLSPQRRRKHRIGDARDQYVQSLLPKTDPVRLAKQQGPEHAPHHLNLYIERRKIAVPGLQLPEETNPAIERTHVIIFVEEAADDPSP